MVGDLPVLPGMLTTGLDAYEQPMRGPAGRARAVVRPQTIAEVQDILRWAIADRVPVLPQGANTGLVSSSIPDDSGAVVVLSTERMNGMMRIDPVERTATVGAGVRLSTLNGAAAAYGLHLPIDLSADPALGGMVSTNTGGTRVLRYGALRHHVLDLQMVTADDATSVLGGDRAVRKDSRGVDFTQMCIGAGGTLGVVTRVTISLTPIPTERATWWIMLEPGREIDLLACLEQADVGLSAFELVSANALLGPAQSPSAARLPFPELANGGAAALIEVEGPKATSHRLADIFAQAAQDGLLSDAVEMPFEKAWQIRHAVPDGLRCMGLVLGHDVAVPRRRIPAVRAAAAGLVAAIAPRATLCDFGHVGDGGLHLNVLFPRAGAPPTADERAELRAAMDALVAPDGTFSAEHGLGPLNAATWLASSTPIERAVITALKQVVDPHGILGHPGHPYNRLRLGAY